MNLLNKTLLFLKKRLRPFINSEDYWIKRYERGGNSGPGSYNKLAEFKAEIINNFVQDHNITTIIEYGCGDGNQLKLAEYPSYIGFDISTKAIDLCQKTFPNDKTKNFKLLNEYHGEKATLTLSLDVIYHLVEDDVYTAYMTRLFSSSEQFVIIYSSNFDSEPESTIPHVRHRSVTNWVENNQPNWGLLQLIPNKFPYKGDVKEGSHSDFYIFRYKD